MIELSDLGNLDTQTWRLEYGLTEPSVCGVAPKVGE